MKTDTKTYLKKPLDDISDRHYPVNADGFYDKAHFRFCLEEVYALIAERECKILLKGSKKRKKGMKMNAKKDEDRRRDCDKVWLTPLEFDIQDWRGTFRSFRERCEGKSYSKFINISSDAFEKLFGYVKKDGTVRKVPYSRLLKILTDEKIIVINNHYKGGGHGFCKSYLLHSDFVRDMVGLYISTRSAEEDADLHECFQAHPSRRSVMMELKMARELYRSLNEIGGLRIKLPKDWDVETGIDEWGRFSFDDEGLTVKKLYSGLNDFRNHKKGHYSGGRYYDWFVRCPAPFRKYIYRGNRHYRELIDCHSGFIWMFAIYGVRMGQVSVEECRRMIDHYISGTFYSDLADAPKRNW